MSTTKRKSRNLPPPSTNGDSPHVAAMLPSTARRKKRRGKRPPERIKRRVVVDQIRRLVSEADQVDLRRPLMAVARAVSAGTKPAEVTRPGGLLDAVIDAAERCENVAGRVIAAEAAVWALAWAARSKRASIASGASLERIVKIADSLHAAIEAGDTASAGFLLVLGRLFADVEACEAFVPPAVAAVEREITEVVPAGGPIARTGSQAILETVARWAGFDSRLVATGAAAWGGTTGDALRSAIETAARLLPGVRQEESRGGLRAGAAAILDVAGRLGVKPSLNQSGCGLAIIRSGSRRRDTRILVDARGPGMYLELVVGGRILCCGEWSFQASADGVAVEPTGGWSDSCFESEKILGTDGETTFAEWTLPLSRGLRLERQVVFAPRDRVLLLADAIVPSDESQRTAPADTTAVGMEIEYRGGLPVCPAIEFESADETRELIGFDESVRLMAMPLSLPEWSSVACEGRLEAESGRLVMTRRSRVARMYAPVWLDLDPSRIGERLTWRRLTVADSRQNLPEHRACGYRVQVGGSQWLVYRGLDAVRNRSVIGCNLACEFLLGRIGRTGMVERLIEIQ